VGHISGSRHAPSAGAARPLLKWCFERGQRGAKLCEHTEKACSELLKINPEIATGSCQRVEPNLERSGSTVPPPGSKKRASAQP
jgi:hypothetical protein